MAALMTLIVEYEGGETLTLPVLPKTQVAFERHFKTGIGTVQNEPRLEHLYWLAWDAERVSGRVVKPFDSWLDEIISVTSEEEPGAPLEGVSPA